MTLTSVKNIQKKKYDKQIADNIQKGRHIGQDVDFKKEYDSFQDDKADLLKRFYHDKIFKSTKIQ